MLIALGGCTMWVYEGRCSRRPWEYEAPKEKGWWGRYTCNGVRGVV